MESEPLRYHHSGDPVRPGDRVRYAGAPGRVVFVNGPPFASFEAAEADWSDLGRGLMVAVDGGDWFFLDDGRDEEDLVLVGRGGPGPGGGPASRWRAMPR